MQGRTALSAGLSNDRITSGAGVDLLTGSTDADASAEWALLLVNTPVLTAGDFVF